MKPDYIIEDLQNTFSKQVLKQAKKSGIYGLGESYLRGEWNTNNLTETIYNILVNNRAILPARSWQVYFNSLIEALVNTQVNKGVYTVAKRHYDLGNDLFSAMLDQSMSYTCGIWQAASNLEQAQNRKLDLICNKLDLKPGQTVLDIGCGWGNFAYYAAKNYQVNVTGLTISKEQAEFAAKKCLNLPVKIILQDYRKVSEKFDKIVSIEMIEAVGKRNLKIYFKTIANALKPKGIFVLQAISAQSFSSYSDPALDQFLVWLKKHIFPNGYIPNLNELTGPSKNLFNINSLENFQSDYAKTLAAWQENFISAWPKLKSEYSDEFFRIWIFYLSGCEAFFKAGLVNLYQIVYRLK